VYEIPEIRRYWARLDAAVLAWSFLLAPGDSLWALGMCLLPASKSSRRAGSAAG
jgi:hypothetical protein